jgi:PAS domain S-box-containing protein
MYANSAAKRKLGYSYNELKAMHILDLHAAVDRPEAEVIFASMFKGERDVCPLPLESSTGKLMPVETRVWFGKWSGEDCIFGICRDLSREQEALQKFDRLFSGNPAAMAVTSFPEERFTDVSDSFLRPLGYSRTDIIGRTSEELNLFEHPEKRQMIAAQLRE